MPPNLQTEFTKLTNGTSPTYIRIKVLPKSAKNAFIGILDCKETTFKIRIKAPPEKGKANQELIKFLAKELNTSKENIIIISGATDSLKLIKIQNI